ncbi:PIG-L family deacetylase [Allobranchiibius sp. CTAmp26]|uniref:PIG-L family deacetylase n=1 Tax=Allobranchiibius sp. CTAmp26 TaxID=2815214 RepID=UPI001AA1A198|nr:PIG-L family deacetylase [Allobranchiibius sp. CTAmp26]MBO1756579.1 PIG-L family deacetylase [Allobranchiibius sp. CTAmp26]
MSTLVFLHAHPDDEASSTSGSIARAVHEGHRVVVVFATNGDHGEVADDLAEGETVLMRRRTEAAASGRVLGVHRIEWLGYADSGMTGWAQNDAEAAFARADVDEAAGRLAGILDDEDADDLIGYDWHGGYGHPDHVRVHHVAHRAASLARRTPRMLEVTMNRDAMRAMMAGAPEGPGFDVDGPMDDGNPMGLPQDEIHWDVDVSDYLDTKRASMQAHASQVSDIGMFMAMPPEIFSGAFGHEYYVEPGRPAGMTQGWPFG